MRAKDCGYSSLCWAILCTFIVLCLVPSTFAATEYNRYLSQVFKKYGSGNAMTFEGLEHLMYNLGLGGIEFDPQHTVDEHRSHDKSMDGNEDKDAKIGENIFDAYTQEQKLPWDINENSDVFMKDGIIAKNAVILEFREMHDPKHRHPREKANHPDIESSSSASLSENVCLSPQEVLRLVVNHDDLHNRKLYRTIAASSTLTTTTPSKSIKSNSATGKVTEENSNVEHNTEAEYIDFINNVQLTPLAFMKLCPALLAQIDQHVCARPAPLRHADDTKEELWTAWIYASTSIFILSACGLLGIALVPLMETVAYKEILKFLVAIAVGTLTGDALMHLLPHALVKEHDDAPSSVELKPTNAGHAHDNAPVWICACAFATAVFMYILEHLLPLLRGQNGHGHGHSHGHGHGHSHSITPVKIISETTEQAHQYQHDQLNHNPQQQQHHHHHQHDNNDDVTTSKIIKLEKPHTSLPIESATSDIKEIKELNVMLNETKIDMKKPKSRPLTPVAFMVIIGDGLHNLTDGLAIGAAFATDPVTGIATAFAVLCHELPHELGDFALLLQTGVSIRRAVYLNIVSSILSFLGMAIGLLIAGMHSNMTQWIYAGTAGSFLYIAFADLMPAMNEDGNKSIKNVLIQISGIIIGGIIMIIIALNEESIEELFRKY